MIQIDGRLSVKALISFPPLPHTSPWQKCLLSNINPPWYVTECVDFEAIMLSYSTILSLLLEVPFNSSLYYQIPKVSFAAHHWIYSGCVAQNGRQCSGVCDYQGYSYIWCWTEGGGWDYCDESCRPVPTTTTTEAPTGRYLSAIFIPHAWIFSPWQSHLPQ